MKYQTEIAISASVEEVCALFNDPACLQEWQEGLKSHEMIEGNFGETGAKSRLVYAGRKGDLEMFETVLKGELPSSHDSEYRSKGVRNQVFNSFEQTRPGETRWCATHVFRFRGMMALMAPFMKQAFEANTGLTMQRFKQCVESKTTD